jgi:glucan-binding YG repeat protein
VIVSRKQKSWQIERGKIMKKHTKQFLVPCAAIAFTIGASMTSLAATGWQEEGGTWRYYNSGGDMATECWKKSGDHWFWLDSDGEMLTDSLVEDGEDYYYVNEAGAMVKNEWRELDNTDDGDDEADTCWYYLGANGKALKAPGSGKTSFKTIKGSKYAFDEEGRMLYGWVDEDSGRVTEEDAWKTGVYYLGPSGDGVLRTNKWESLQVEDDENQDDDFDGYYWFWFGTNGKKVHDTTKTINGRKYRFEENGNALFNWYSTPGNATLASTSNMYYNSPEKCWQAKGWFQAVPDENTDPEGYEDGDICWYYAQTSGELVKSQIKKINGQYYGFDEYGKMLHGLYKMSVNNREIQSYEEIENQSDLPEEGDAWQVYYFGDSPKEGAMKTGNARLEVDGEDYTYEFKKSGSERGEGYDGIQDGSIYIKGRLLKADKDAKLEKVTYGGEEYLINTSGKIQKNKKNARDADDKYYCTDSKGIVTYEGSEKWEKED